YILEKGDVRRRSQIVAFMGWNRKFLDGVPAHDGSVLTIFSILRNEFFCRRCPGHCKTNPRAVGEFDTIRSVVDAHDDIRSSRYQKSRVDRTIIFIWQSGQVAKLVAAAYRLTALIACFFRAAHRPPDDDAFLGVDATTAILTDSVLISRHFHSFIHVVQGRGFMLLEIKAIVMDYR